MSNESNEERTMVTGDFTGANSSISIAVGFKPSRVVFTNLDTNVDVDCRVNQDTAAHATLAGLQDVWLKASGSPADAVDYSGIGKAMDDPANTDPIGNLETAGGTLAGAESEGFTIKNNLASVTDVGSVGDTIRYVAFR